MEISSERLLWRRILQPSGLPARLGAMTEAPLAPRLQQHRSSLLPCAARAPRKEPTWTWPRPHAHSRGRCAQLTDAWCPQGRPRVPAGQADAGQAAGPSHAAMSPLTAGERKRVELPHTDHGCPPVCGCRGGGGGADLPERNGAVMVRFL